MTMKITAIFAAPFYSNFNQEPILDFLLMPLNGYQDEYLSEIRKVLGLLHLSEHQSCSPLESQRSQEFKMIAY